MASDKARRLEELPKNTAVIGRLPGYNQATDPGGVFAKELLKGITFIDLRPMTYQFGPAITADTSIAEFFTNMKKAIKEPGLFDRQTAKSTKLFKGILKRMENDFNLSSGFANAEMLRIIGSNDSTFTETFSNSYDGQNIVGEAVDGVSSTLKNNVLGKTGVVALKGLKSYSHAEMIDLAGGAAALAGNNDISSIASGALFGMNMAVPSVWQQSNYSSTLTLFIKLVAPVGTAACVKRNILEPILYLLAAASPITYSGLMYGFPLLWDIQAHGITNFRIGGIAAMSIIKGSFETTFNHLLQPTVVDVRLTLIPILNEFAVQTAKKDGTSAMDSIYTHPDTLGVQNPGDIVRGITNQNVDKSQGSSSNGTLQIDLKTEQVQIMTIKL